MATLLTPEQIEAQRIAERDQLIMEWSAKQAAIVKMKAHLKELTDSELEQRKQLVKMNFFGAKSGTNRVQLGSGYALKAVIKYYYKITKNEKVDPADYSHLPEVLSKLPPEIGHKIIKWTPELNESLYKTLTKEQADIVDLILIKTDGAGELVLEVPKEKK